MNDQHSNEHNTFVEEANRKGKIEAAISRTLDASALKHQDDRATAVRAIINKLEADGITLRVSDRNWVVPEKNGMPMNLQKTVDDVLLLDKTIGDPQSIAEAVAKSEIAVAARSDFSTPQQKIEYIRKFGVDAWTKLPMQRSASVTNYDLMTAAELKTLPLSIKAKLTERQISDALRRR